jgi:hypothetical protein
MNEANQSNGWNDWNVWNDWNRFVARVEKENKEILTGTSVPLDACLLPSNSSLALIK